MRSFIFFLLLLCGLSASSVVAVTWAGQDFTLVASTIQGSPFTDKTFKIVAEKEVYFKMIDQTAGTFFEAYSTKMTAFTIPAEGANGSVKSAELCGPVKLVYTTCDPTTKVRSVVTATADSATYDGAQQTAYLTGNIKIVNDNPIMFSQPAVMTGDKATINLKPGSSSFRVESSPGLSRIQVTPKKEATQ